MKLSITKWMIIFATFVGMNGTSLGAQDVGNYLTKKMFRYPINKTSRLITNIFSTDVLKVDNTNYVARATCESANINHNFSTNITDSDVICYKLDVPFFLNPSKHGGFNKQSNDFASISWIPYQYYGMKLDLSDENEIYIRGFSDRVTAKANVMQIGEGNADSHWTIRTGQTVEIDGYAVIHAKSLTMQPGSKLFSRNGGAVIILDEKMVAKGSGNCNIKNLISGKSTEASECIMINGIDVVSRYYNVSENSIELSYVIGDYRPASKKCKNCEYIRNSINPDKTEYTLVPTMARFAASHISLSDVIFGDYNLDWDLPDDPKIVNYSVDLPASQLISCEDALITISSDSEETTSVEVQLDGIGYFSSTGTKNVNINVSQSKPVILSVSSQGVGTTSVSLSEPMKCSSNPCSFTFGDLALRFYEQSDSGKISLSKALNFYAGMQQQYFLGVVVANDENICERIRVKNDEFILKTDSENHTLVDFSDQKKAIANVAGVTLALDYKDGYYSIPSLTDNDAGSFSLSAETTLEGDVDLSKLSSQINLSTSPYAMYLDFSAEACTNCHQEIGEKFDAGQDIRLDYIPKAWCNGLKTLESAGGNFVVVSNTSLKNCPTTGSFYGAKGETVAVYGIKKDADIKKPVENYLNYQTVTLKNTGAKLSTINQIENVGEMKFGIDSFYDSVTNLKVNGSILDSVEGYFAPWAFEISYVPGETYAVSNSCLNSDATHHSFTYFGQPFPIKLYVIAKTANGNTASLFDNDNYVNAQKYISDIVAINSSGDLLVNSDGTSRIESCGIGCSGVEPQWRDGILDLSNYYMKLYPKGVNRGNYGKDAIKDYRDELPVYKTSESELVKRHNAFFSNLVMRVLVQTDDNSLKNHKIDFEKSFNEPSSIYYGLNKEFNIGLDKYIRLFGPLDLRMGRIKIENERTNNFSSLYMPVQIQYFTKFGDGTIDWITNEDDICTRLGRQNFYISSYTNASGPNSDLRNSNIADFGDNIKSVVEIVSERKASSEVKKEILDGVEDQFAIAKNGTMFIRFSQPKKQGNVVRDQILFFVHAFTETEHYEGTVPTLLTPLKSYKTSAAVTSYPYWFGISQESKELAFGAFRAWPGNDRVLYRIDSLY